MTQYLDKPIYVVGHKNPDTDAICSAIGHAALLTEIGYSKVEPIRCGDVPERTMWALEQAGIEAPRLVTDVRANAGDLVTKSKDYCVCVKETILTAYRTMVEADMKSVPVVRNKEKVVGMLKLVDLLQLMMPAQTQGAPVKTIHASLANAVITLEGESVGAKLPSADKEEKLVLFVAASSANTMDKRLSEGLEDGVSNKIAICGDRPDVQRNVIEQGVRGLVVTGGFTIADELLELAKQKGIVVIYSKHDTASTVQLMRCSRCVIGALTDDFTCVRRGEAVSSFKANLTASNHDLFPVVETGSFKLVGSFPKSALIDPPRHRLVLVDHNEYAQAVKGVEEAQVLEVIDHHRLAGNIVSREPITYLNEPVGSSCTLVARKFMYRNLKPERGIAICLISGLVSDTLNLTSPTTTDLDREILAWLCEIAGIDAATFTRGFFEAGSLLLHGSADDIVGVDRKEFNEEGAFVSISQVEEIVVDSLPSRIEEIKESLQKLVDAKGYDIAIIAVTDISSHSSTILYAGSEKIANALPYEQSEPGLWNAPGVVSRKKQIFPAMCEAICNASAMEVES